MRKILLYILSVVILITCTRDAFEEETEAPVVLFNVEVASGEGGSVSSSGGSFESGSTVTITATPDSEYLFVGWTGTESTDNPLTITVNSNQEITANFEKKKYQLSVNVTGEGTDANAQSLHVFALNYNVLRIMSGMGGLAYSN